jgi:predicted DNA-binding protein (MmcQ/YjbR family)
MNVEYFREYCLNKKNVTESFPFDNEALVFKVNNKMFGILPINSKPLQMNLKCEPEYALELREKYSEITPGYHMNKKMWNTVVLEGNVSVELFCKLIDHSYHEVIKTFPLKVQKDFL